MLPFPPEQIKEIIKIDETELNVVEQIYAWLSSICDEVKQVYSSDLSKKFGYLRIKCESYDPVFSKGVVVPGCLELVAEGDKRCMPTVYVYAGLQLFVRIAMWCTTYSRIIEAELIYARPDNLLSLLSK